MRCPICEKEMAEPAAGEERPNYFPFCSERCKLIDLGRWLSGKYQVPVEERRGEHEGEDRSDEC